MTENLFKMTWNWTKTTDIVWIAFFLAVGGESSAGRIPDDDDAEESISDYVTVNKSPEDGGLK